MLWCVAATAAAMAAVLAAPCAAQTFPERTIKLIVPVPPGGSTDAVSRLVTARMQAILGQPVIIENQPGGGGVIAARAVAGARPDGYTLLIGGIGTLAIGPAVKTPDFNPATAFTPVATVSTETMVLAVNPKVPADTLAAFVRYAKAGGAKLNYGSAPGIAPHFISELFKLRTGADIVHIPYKGAGPVVTDLLAGQIDLRMAAEASHSCWDDWKMHGIIIQLRMATANIRRATTSTASVRIPRCSTSARCSSSWQQWERIG